MHASFLHYVRLVNKGGGVNDVNVYMNRDDVNIQ